MDIRFKSPRSTAHALSTLLSSQRSRRRRGGPRRFPSLQPSMGKQQMDPQRGGKSPWTRAPKKLWAASHSFPLPLLPSLPSVHHLSPPEWPDCAEGMFAFDEATAGHRVRAPVNTVSRSLASLTSFGIARDHTSGREGRGSLAQRVSSILLCGYEVGFKGRFMGEACSASMP